jgi:hypothetical protein
MSRRGHQPPNVPRARSGGQSRRGGENDKPAAARDYEVGYGRPPRSGQQQRGAPSKNPKGRPPGIPNPGGLTRAVNKPILATLPDGSTTEMTIHEFIMRQVVRKAAEGDRHFIKLVERFRAREEIHARQADEASSQRAQELEQTAQKHAADERSRDMMFRLTAGFHELMELGVMSIEAVDGHLQFVLADWLIHAAETRQAADEPPPMAKQQQLSLISRRLLPPSSR